MCCILYWRFGYQLKLNHCTNGLCNNINYNAKLKRQGAFSGVQAVKAFKHKSIKRHYVLISQHLTTEIIVGIDHYLPW